MTRLHPGRQARRAAGRPADSPARGAPRYPVLAVWRCRLVAYGARLLSGLRVTPSRGFKSRHLRQIPTAPSRLPRWAGAVRVLGLVRARSSPSTGSGTDLSVLVTTTGS